MNLIIDGDMVLHRALYAKNLVKMSTSSGVYTGIVYSAVKSIGNYLTALAQYRPDRVFFLLGHGQSRRVNIYPDYKKKSEKDIESWTAPIEGIGKSNKELYNEQKALVPEILEAMGVFSLAFPTYEADDLAFLLSRTFDNAGQKCTLISDDGDWSQLVTPNIQLLKPTSEVLVTHSNFVDTLQIPPESMVCYLALLGGHDNIPKPLPGFGEAGIKKMIQSLTSYTVDDVVSYGKAQKADTLKAKLADKDVCEKMHLNYQLVDMSALHYTPEVKSLIRNAIESRHSFTMGSVHSLFNKYEFKSLTSVLTDPVFRALH